MATTVLIEFFSLVRLLYDGVSALNEDGSHYVWRPWVQMLKIKPKKTFFLDLYTPFLKTDIQNNMFIKLCCYYHRNMV